MLFRCVYGEEERESGDERECKGKKRSRLSFFFFFFVSCSHFYVFSLSSFPLSLVVLLRSLSSLLVLPPKTPVTMGLTFTKLFARLFSKREMRILMVSGRKKKNRFFFLLWRKRKKNDRWKKSSPTARERRRAEA